MALKINLLVLLRQIHLKKTVCERGKKLNKLKSQKQSEENIINSIRNPFILKIENKEMKDRIIRDIRTLFEQDNDDYYKPKRVSKF